MPEELCVKLLYNRIKSWVNKTMYLTWHLIPTLVVYSVIVDTKRALRFDVSAPILRYLYFIWAFLFSANLYFYST